MVTAAKGAKSLDDPTLFQRIRGFTLWRGWADGTPKDALPTRAIPPHALPAKLDPTAVKTTLLDLGKKAKRICTIFCIGADKRVRAYWKDSPNFRRLVYFGMAATGVGLVVRWNWSRMDANVHDYAIVPLIESGECDQAIRNVQDLWMQANKENALLGIAAAQTCSAESSDRAASLLLPSYSGLQAKVQAFRKWVEAIKDQSDCVKAKEKGRLIPGWDTFPEEMTREITRKCMQLAVDADLVNEQQIHDSMPSCHGALEGNQKFLIPGNREFNKHQIVHGCTNPNIREVAAMDITNPQLRDLSLRQIFADRIRLELYDSAFATATDIADPASKMTALRHLQKSIGHIDNPTLKRRVEDAINEALRQMNYLKGV